MAGLNGTDTVKVDSHLWRVMRGPVSLGWSAASRNPAGMLEMGWATREEHRDAGVATDAARTALAWLQEHHPGEPVIASIRPANTASLRVAEKIGMRPIGAGADLADIQVTMVVGPAPAGIPQPHAGLAVVPDDPVRNGGLLGRADWRWDHELRMHIPCCSRRIGMVGRCGNGPLGEAQVAAGDCGEHEEAKR